MKYKIINLHLNLLFAEMRFNFEICNLCDRHLHQFIILEVKYDLLSSDWDILSFEMLLSASVLQYNSTPPFRKWVKIRRGKSSI